MSDSGITIGMEWVQTEDHLIAAYTVENRSSGVVVVFDRLFLTRRDGGRIVDADRAYVSVTADAGLRVEKIVPSLPEDMAVERPEVPYVRVLQPGERLEGRAVVTKPVLTTPAYGVPTDGAFSDRVRTAVFRIGLAVVDDRFTAAPVPGQEGVWSVPYAWAATRQQMWTGPLIEIDTGVVQPLPGLR